MKKDYVEMDHLTEFDAFMLNRDQAVNLQIYKTFKQTTATMIPLVYVGSIMI